MPQKVEIKWFETTDSTNNRALEGAEKAPDRFTWASDFQTAGRGQRGNKWTSKAGDNIMFSTIFKPGFISAQEQFAISQICTLGLLNYLKTKGINAKIKWPNDIYVGDKKICGMLIENAITGDKLSQSICGIGLNVNQRAFPENIPNPTSMALILESGKTGKEPICFNTHDELPLLLQEIFKEYERVRKEHVSRKNFSKLTERYLSALYRIGEFHKYIDMTGEEEKHVGNKKGKVIEAKIVGIDENSCLVLENKKGERKTFAFKEISYIINP
ncbi:MAG: biotin--[acetyl-CoA-carboxylase] ligase [Bacteroidales bacterium]|jgi:BirA family biotin operon repressor/biotin-[acetyl-CoA-carboxylase] ligase|nr:biotin--[acetyl-CoA-carboxylase] ligase [Bacteroidales bacterium]MCI1733317.1 biotin--[acetyl-CoA-carboxylase] ligase [Bacteroidales bacterium]